MDAGRAAGDLSEVDDEVSNRTEADKKETISNRPSAEKARTSVQVVLVHIVLPVVAEVGIGI